MTRWQKVKNHGWIRNWLCKFNFFEESWRTQELTFQASCLCQQRSQVTQNYVKVALMLLTPPLRNVRGVNFFEYIWSTYRTMILFFWRKEQGWRHLLHTLNMIIWPIEIFLEHLKKIWPQKRRIYQKFPVQLLLHFWDNCISV